MQEYTDKYNIFVYTEQLHHFCTEHVLIPCVPSVGKIGKSLPEILSSATLSQSRLELIKFWKGGKFAAKVFLLFGWNIYILLKIDPKLNTDFT